MLHKNKLWKTSYPFCHSAGVVSYAAVIWGEVLRDDPNDGGVGD